MKKVLFFAAILVVSSTLHAFGNNDIVQEGMQLLRKHHYHEAADRLYHGLLISSTGQNRKAQLNFGMACMANARCYDRLDKVARPLQIEYLKRLIKTDRNAEESFILMAELYLGKAQLASGRPDPAITSLEKFLKTPKMPSLARHEASIALGAAKHAKGQIEQAKKIWSQIPTDNPQTAIMLAAAMQKADMDSDKVLSLANNGCDRLLKTDSPIPIQCVSALLSIYSRHNMTDKGFAIISRTDLKSYTRQENVGTHKTILFYDETLLQNLAVFYNQCAINAFNKVKQAKDKKISMAAGFYASEAYAFANRMDEASQAINKLLSIKLPKAISHRARIRQVMYAHKQEHSKPIFEALKPTIGKGANSAIISDIIQLCAQQQIKCPAVLDHANAIWRKSHGRPPLNLGMALGYYYRNQKDHNSALEFLEAARDKSKKNRIEANPPVMLADLAWAYYHNRQFSEALEIYFEMSKQFPAVRQIQIALQGIYSMEQQSAGDAKIF